MVIKHAVQQSDSILAKFKMIFKHSQETRIALKDLLHIDIACQSNEFAILSSVADELHLVAPSSAMYTLITPRRDRILHQMLVQREKMTSERITACFVSESGLDPTHNIASTNDPTAWGREVFSGQFRRLKEAGQSLEEYSLVCRIGQGATSQVYLATHPCYQLRLALKNIDIGCLDELAVERCRREVQLMQQLQTLTLRSPFINYTMHCIQYHNRIALVSEAMLGGDLYFHLQKQRRFLENE